MIIFSYKYFFILLERIFVLDFFEKKIIRSVFYFNIFVLERFRQIIRIN